MNGFHTFKDYEVIKEHKNRAGNFKLIVQDEDMEIYESYVRAGKSIICQPYESKEAINVIFVNNGKLFHSNEKKFIFSGERITFKNLKETHHLSVVEDAKLLVIRNKKLFTVQSSTADEVYELVYKLQEKDYYTEEHCNDTGNLAVQIATFMKLNDDVIENVLYAGKIHDVGKINIPLEILNKPGKLTKDEFDIVKNHPKSGYDIIMELMNNDTLAKIILEHHERLDGSGYPYGLTGDKISIEAKIIAVADSFDAMTSERSYAKAISPDEALTDLKKHKNTLYDAQIVDILENIIECNKPINT